MTGWRFKSLLGKKCGSDENVSTCILNQFGNKISTLTLGRSGGVLGLAEAKKMEVSNASYTDDLYLGLAYAAAFLFDMI